METPDATGREPVPAAPATVVVTRPRHRASAMVEALTARGLDVLLAPTVSIGGPPDPGPLEEAARRIRHYDWIAFTSPAGVAALVAAGVRPEDVAEGVGPRVAAVGPSTSRAVQDRLGRPPDLVPEDRYSGAGLASAFEGVANLVGARVLLPLAEAAADLLHERLQDLGARAERVTAYRSVPAEGVPVADVRSAIEDGRVALLTFTSPSTAENFLDAVGEAALTVPAAAIGPTTAARARELGYRVTVVPDEHTVEGLVGAVVEALSVAVADRAGERE